MFNHPGKKIMLFAKILFWIQGIASTVLPFVGLVMFLDSEPELIEFIGVFFLCIVGVAIAWVLAWVTSIFIYGFGQLIDDTEVSREAALAMVHVSKNRF